MIDSIHRLVGVLTLLIQLADTAKADLEADSRLKGKYIMLDRVDVHCIWVSKAVLNLLPAELPEIPGGEIITDPGPGVFCDNAMDLVMKYWPRPSTAKKTQFVKAAMTELNKVGLVGMHDAGVPPADLSLYESLADADSWTVRVYAMTECEKRNTFCPGEARMISRDDGLLSVRSVKLFAGKSSLYDVEALMLKASRWCAWIVGQRYAGTLLRPTFDDGISVG
jgi:predicted amidohydrolase YtcJ